MGEEPEARSDLSNMNTQGIAMTAFEYGPVEFYLVGFEGDQVDSAVLKELRTLTDSESVRLLDFVLVTKDTDGRVTFAEVTDVDELDLDRGSLGAAGIAGREDIEELAVTIEPGASAALVVLELLYQRALAERVTAAGGALLSYDRVSAPVVNALMDAFAEEIEE